MKHLWMALVVCLTAITSLAEFTIVRDGKSEAVIEVGEKPVASVQMAAYELQHHVKLMTGVEVPIVTKAPSSVKQIIKLGGGNEKFIGERHVRKFSGNTLHLTGTDTLDYRKVNYKSHFTYPPYTQAYNGTLYAVYDFLEDLCGVRFYGMDENGTVYDKRKSLSVKEIDRDFAPPMDAFRDIHHSGQGKAKCKETARDLALWRFRWRQSSFFGQGNHNQYSIFFKHWGKARNPHLAKAFTDKREALFAQGFKGKNHGADPILRTNFPLDRDLPPQLCYSNHDTAKYYADEVLTYFNGGNVPGGWLNFGGSIPGNRTLLHRFPGKPFFYPIQGGDTGGHCLCDNCKKRFPDDNKDNVSNNKFQFIADVAREAAKTNPTAGVSSLAYIQTLNYPEKVVFPDNVSIQLCLTIYSWWHPMSEKLQMEAYKKWIRLEAKKRPLTLWTYIFSTYWDSHYHFSKYKPFPGLYPWKTGEIFKMFAEDGIRGWFTEADLLYNHLETYVAQKICYDPSLDPNKILEEYFARYYGDAGPAMKEFYREIEKAYWNPANCPPDWLKNKKEVVGPRGVKHPYWGTGLHSPDVNWALGTPERMKKLDDLIKKAQKQVKTPAEKVRLSRIVDHIWTPAVEGLREYKLWQIKRTQPPRTVTVSSMAPANGDFAEVNWSQGTKPAVFVNVDGKDAAHGGNVVFASDDHYFYIKYTDKNAPDKMENIWKENVELFMTADGKHPVLHYTFSPSGNSHSYRHEIINDSKKLTTSDFGIKTTQKIGKDSWEVMMAIPRKNIPVAADGSLIFNLCRTSPKGNTVWNPIYTNSYIDGMDSFGKVRFLPLLIKPEAFHYHLKKTNSDLVADPANSGKRVGMMLANQGWSLQYRFPAELSDGTPYRIKLRFKAVLPENARKNMRNQIGIYDPTAKKIVAFAWVQTDEAIKGYCDVVLPPVEIPKGSYLYIGGLSSPCPGAKFYCESISITRQ